MSCAYDMNVIRVRTRLRCNLSPVSSGLEPPVSWTHTLRLRDWSRLTWLSVNTPGSDHLDQFDSNIQNKISLEFKIRVSVGSAIYEYYVILILYRDKYIYV